MDKKEIFKILTHLSGLNNATIADLAGVKRPNLYSWLGGKTQAMSDENIEKLFNVLGVYKGKLSSEIVYRWQADADLQNIKAVLTHFLEQNVLDKADINFIEIEGYETTLQEKYNLIHIPGAKDSLTILLANNSPQQISFPVKSSKLGFGKDNKRISISIDQWSRWWGADNLSSSAFWIEASLYLSSQTKNVQVNDELDIDLLTTYQSQLVQNTAENAGLRAIIRALLRELRNLKPKHKLLDKANRDVIFNEFYAHEIDKLRKSSFHEDT